MRIDDALLLESQHAWLGHLPLIRRLGIESLPSMHDHALATPPTPPSPPHGLFRSAATDRGTPPSSLDHRDRWFRLPRCDWAMTGSSLSACLCCCRGSLVLLLTGSDRLCILKVARSGEGGGAAHLSLPCKMSMNRGCTSSARNEFIASHPELD